MFRNGKSLILFCLLFLGVFGVLYLPLTHSSSRVEVGIYYYGWYEEGHGSKNWREEEGSENAVDRPFLGYYDSTDPELCRRHVNWLRQLGVDFVIVSWWGPDTYTDESISVLFDTVRQYGGNLKLAVMVEPFREGKDGYNYKEIYDYIHGKYSFRYPSIYYKYQDKPLLCFYNAPGLTEGGDVPDDDRFTSIIVGHLSYVDWVYWSVPNKIVQRTINVTPRYDDSRVRRPMQTIDPSYEDNLYDKQWEKALVRAVNEEIDIIMITSFNEFHERTQIEPCFDATTHNDYAFLVFDKTMNYIRRLREDTSP